MHSLLPTKKDSPPSERQSAPPSQANQANLNTDLQALELIKVKGAIRTDFVLSAEIIVITLGIVADAPFMQQLIVLAGIAVVMTIGVYGVVAGIVKLDDLGLYLSKKAGIWHNIGLKILAACPYLMRTLTVVGTAAMFLVGGQYFSTWPALVNGLGRNGGRIAVSATGGRQRTRLANATLIARRDWHISGHTSSGIV